jgi:hypothetical protein
MKYLFTALLALSLLLASACGDDDDEDGAAGDAAAGATTSTAAATPAATQSGDDSAGGGTSSSAGASDDGDAATANDFESLFSTFGQADYVVTFEIETAIEGQSFSGEWTWFRDVAGERSRFDIDSDVAGESVTATVITTPDESFFCAEGSCLRIPAGAASPFPDLSELFTDQVTSIDDAVLAGSVSDAGTRNIGGVEARCFTFEAPEEDVAKGETCVTAEGVPIYAAWSSDEGEFRLEAVSYSNSVSDDDFEPPFPVTSIPGS